MDDDTLLRRHHENYVGIWALPIGVPPYTGYVRDCLLVVLSGLPVRFFNQIAVDGDPADVTAAALDAAIATAEAGGQPFMLVVRDGIDDAVRAMAEARGLRALGPGGPAFPAMALEPIPPAAAPLPPDFEIRRVTAPADLDAWATIVSAGFGMPLELVAPAMRSLVELPASWNYIGYERGVPVAVGQGIRTGATIGVYTIATLPEARRRGYGAAITRRIVEDGPAAGADVAILQASEMGRPVYEALGFRAVGTYSQLGFPQAEA